MIYLEPLQLGWMPLVTSWLNTLPEPLDQKEYQDLLQGLFTWLAPPALRLRQKKCKVVWAAFSIKQWLQFICAKSMYKTLISLQCIPQRNMSVLKLPIRFHGNGIFHTAGFLIVPLSLLPSSSTLPRFLNCFKLL